MKKIVIGVLAHVDSGKTTLSEALMYCSGNLKKFGRVDHGNSFLDNYSLERDRGITIFSKQAVMNYKDTVFTLMDTPGHVDFCAETERTLQILDYAILVISGTDGVQSHTMTLWKLLKKYNIPCFIFVNKMDLDGADRKIILAALKSKLSDECVDFSDGQDEIYENAALCDDRLFEKYDKSGELDIHDISAAIKDRKVFPCLFGSALRMNGIEKLLACLDEYTVMPDYTDDFAAKVYKIADDKQGSRLTFMKITGGSLKVRDVLSSSRNINAEKVNQIRIYSGEKFTVKEEISAGTVCAVTGITFAKAGTGLGVEQNADLPVLEPVLTYTVQLPEGIDAHKALEKFRILEEEDPQLHVKWDERNESIQVRLMGEIQLEILRSIIMQRFGFEVTFGSGSIIYKETISDTVEGVGHFEPLRHYAEVHLLMKPAKRNSGLVFAVNCREDLLDKNWQRLILTHLYEKTHLGVLTGSPITDMEIILVSGKAHTKHTVGGDFRQATYRAVRQGLRTAKSVLLEPVYEFALEIPSENVGKAISDIQHMCGNFENPETNGDMTLIIGTAPVSEMNNYSREIIRYTHGKGKLICTFKGYEPCHNSEEVIAEKGYDPDSDIENPCDSVFCSHGAGTIVKWNEVKDHMHLSGILNEIPQKITQKRNENSYPVSNGKKDVFASDKELMQIFENTYGAVKKRDTGGKREYVYTPQNSGNNKRPPSPKYSGKEYLLVDGYNVIFAWEELKKLSAENLDAARNTLINILSNYCGYKKCELILVFDAYKVKGSHREVENIGGISIVYTKEAETADMYIEKVTHELAKNHKVRVVTSDGTEQIIILGNGALRVSSQAFLLEVQQAEKEIREIIQD